MLMIISSLSRDSFKMRRLEEQRHVSTAVGIEKSGTEDTMVGQKSGPALAGPARSPDLPHRRRRPCIVVVEV